jgi:hypothetical protein
LRREPRRRVRKNQTASRIAPGGGWFDAGAVF